MHLNPWHILVIAMAGWMNREQSAVIEYLKEENRVLRELLGDKRPRLNDDQRHRLAARIAIREFLEHYHHTSGTIRAWRIG